MEIKLPAHKDFFYIFGTAVFLFAVNILFFSPPSNFPLNEVIPIKSGASLRGISSSFKQNDVIRSRFVFEVLVIIGGGEKHIVSGNYLFEERISVWDVARRVSTGRRGQTAIRVTIPEGFDNKEISELLDGKLLNFNPENFTLLADGKQGYLFPDTYFFFNTDGEEEIIKIMNENFERKFGSLLKGVSPTHTEEDLVIMASLIEREANGSTDREYISGILWKRLKIGMALQVDAAPITYERAGLPDAPIANPGLLALKAALLPKESSYLYYLHDAQGNIYYAKNFEEHKANRLKYLK